MTSFFARHSFKVILVVICVLPIMTRGSRYALTSNNNNVQDWLPAEYPETQDFNWFKKHFENETFVLASWEGCTLGDERVELFAQKIIPPTDANLAQKTPPLFKKIETGPRLVERLTSEDEKTKISQDEALRRLKGLFVGSPQSPVENTQTCAVITLTEAGKKDLRATLKKIYSIAENELALKHTQIRLGGPPVDNVAISVEGERTLMWLLAPAGIVGLALAYWCLRSVRLTVMVFSVALYAGAVSLSIVTYSGGTMNAILLTMPAVVYVTGISGAIHFANYYRDSVVEKGISGAPARAIRHAWLPCTLSAVTTAAGLISLYTSELVPIKYFGIYSAAGVLATLLLLFIFLPAWMQLWPMKLHSRLDGEAPREEDLALPVRWRHFLQGVLNHHRVVFGGLMIVMIACTFGLFEINTSIKLTKLFSSKAEIIRSYEWLEEKLGPLIPMEVIVRVDDDQCPKFSMLERMRLVEQVQAQLQTIKDKEGKSAVGNTLSAVTFAPSLVTRKGLLKRTQDDVLNRQLTRNREKFVEGDLLDTDGSEELWRISARVGALNDIDYGQFLEDIKQTVEPVLQEQRDKLAKAGQEAGADGSYGIHATYTGLVPVVYKAQRAMLEGLAWNFLTDLATIAFVMTIVFWDWSAGLILLIPSIFPVVVVFGLMGWGNIVVDVGTIMTPTVALGVSVDDVVHFLIWYRLGLKQGKSRKDSIMLAYEGCARAMYQSWAVLGLGLAVFSLSSFVPTQRFGAMMFTLLTAALVGNLLLLPAVLASPLAYFFGRRVIKKAIQHIVPAPLNAEPLLTEGSSAREPHSTTQVRKDAPHRVTHS